jgi:hypothetical protein
MIARRTLSGAGQHRFAAVVRLSLAVLLALAGNRVSQADHIDDALIKKAPELAKSLESKGYKSAGVLKFMVKAGKAAPSSNIGAMNLVMATRLENALIHGADSAKPLTVVRNATQVAAASNSKFTIQTPEGRESLFKLKYPVAWGNEQTTPDALLTGLVVLSPDMRKAKVTVDCFDKSGKTPQQVLAFEVTTDRSILADCGRGFVVKDPGVKKRTIEEMDSAAADSAAAATDGKPISQQAAGEIPIKFEIRYNSDTQVIGQDPGSLGEMRVNPPKEGDKVQFVVTNVTASKIAIVVKVNGESTLGQETVEDAACQKWILDPGKTYSLKGFYTYPENKVVPFKVLNDDDSVARLADWSGSRPRSGYIDVSVFVPNPAISDELAAGPSYRGLARTQGKAHHPKTMSEARKQIENMATQTAGKKKRGLIVGETAGESAHLEGDHLDNTTCTFQLQINYYKPASL